MMQPRSLQTFERTAEVVEAGIEKGRLPLLVGIGGPGGSGKSTLSRWLIERLDGAALLHLDDYRLPRKDRQESGLLGSHPEGNDLTRIQADLERARRGETVDQPVFDSEAGRACHTRPVRAERVWICDGEIAAHAPLRSVFDLFILVDCHWRTQLNARLTRDIADRGYDLEKAIEVFLKSNLRDYPRFSEGAAAEADLILYRNTRGAFLLRKVRGL